MKTSSKILTLTKVLLISLSILFTVTAFQNCSPFEVSSLSDNDLDNMYVSQLSKFLITQQPENQVSDQSFVELNVVIDSPKPYVINWQSSNSPSGPFFNMDIKTSTLSVSVETYIMYYRALISLQTSSRKTRAFYSDVATVQSTDTKPDPDPDPDQDLLFLGDFETGAIQDREAYHDGWYEQSMASGRIEENNDEKILPKFEEGESINLDDILSEQHFTKPPGRFSEATLIKSLEEFGIGRPSTYAAIISTLRDRKYVEMEQKRLHPTELGTTVSKILVENFPNLAGQKEMYLAKQLKAFKAGTRKNNEMKFIVKLLTDADIANLAAYFSKLPCCKPVYR